MTDIIVTPITDDNRDILAKIAIANAGTHRWDCIVCGENFLQAESPYWKVHEGCIEEFRANRKKYSDGK